MSNSAAVTVHLLLHIGTRRKLVIISLRQATSLGDWVSVKEWLLAPYLKSVSFLNEIADPNTLRDIVSLLISQYLQ